MPRPSSRTVLASALVATVVLASALTAYSLGFRSSTGLARVVPLPVLFVPAATSVLVLQAIPYPSLRSRVLASLLVFTGCCVITVLVMFIVGCTVYDGCNTR
jgi:hypothetical protein